MPAHSCIAGDCLCYVHVQSDCTCMSHLSYAVVVTMDLQTWQIYI
jgi:hypothetical protein